MLYKSKYTGPQIDDILDSVGGKQNEIEDLASIRSGAAKGATALQSYTEKYTGTITGIKMNGASKGTSGVVDLGTVITAHQDISGKADKSSLAVVATSGSYNDLSNKPTIPAAVTESTVSGWGFTKNTGTYSKPSTGIPKSDLASAVQTSLGKADTALQSYTEQYKGTVTKVKINGSEKSPDSNGLVDLGTIEGGSSSGGGKEIVEIDVREGAIAFIGEESRPSFEPNKIYYVTTPVEESVAIYTVIPPTEDIGEYSLHFSYGNPSFALFEAPSDWLWANGIPTTEAGVSYELSVVATKFGDDYIYKAVLTPFKPVE